MQEYSLSLFDLSRIMTGVERAMPGDVAQVPSAASVSPATNSTITIL